MDKRNEINDLLILLASKVEEILEEEELTNKDYFKPIEIITLAIELVKNDLSQQASPTTKMLIGQVDRSAVKFVIDETMTVDLFNNDDEDVSVNYEE